LDQLKRRRLVMHALIQRVDAIDVRFLIYKEAEILPRRQICQARADLFLCLPPNWFPERRRHPVHKYMARDAKIFGLLSGGKIRAVNTRSAVKLSTPPPPLLRKEEKQ
jgi:hypothetical protein